MPIQDPRYRYCPKAGSHVLICRPEGECRDQHHCEAPDCPLTKEFGLSRFDRRMRQLASTFNFWPVSGKRK